MLVLGKINSSPTQKVTLQAKTKPLGHLHARSSARIFLNLQTYRLESFRPQGQGHCFIHFAFSVLKIRLSKSVMKAFLFPGKLLVFYFGDQ